jgi:hypothetical protein
MPVNERYDDTKIHRFIRIDLDDGPTAVHRRSAVV